MNYSTTNELLSLEKVVSAWSEWESALRDLQGALHGDHATLQALRDRGTALADHAELAAHVRQLAVSLLDKKKVSLVFLIKYFVLVIFCWSGCVFLDIIIIVIVLYKFK